MNLYVGTQSNGQGHETVYTQILHDRTGIPFEAIRIVQGDSDRIATGGGTGGPRSVTTQGTAIYGASADLIEKMRPWRRMSWRPRRAISCGRKAPGASPARTNRSTS